MGQHGYSQDRAWVTLLTRASYLPGVMTLAYSLSKHKSQYPLIVLTTPTVPDSCLRALELESKHDKRIIVRPIEPLTLPNNQKTTLIAARFEDTWTKLRAFELVSHKTCCFLDADITVYQNMDDVFDIRLPSSDWIAANHTCVCNLDKDKWAPEEWKPSNCPYSVQSHPSALQQGTAVPKDASPPDVSAQLNGGLFLYHPTEALWSSILQHFNTSPSLSSYKFPDQDFLADFFCHKWAPVSWKYNAIKTMENWHRNIWRDDKVCGLHYIVDKPWQKRIASDGIAGHMGRDGKTHGWWWQIWEEWCSARDAEEVDIVQELVAKPLDAESDMQQCKENQKEGLPVPINFRKEEGNEGMKTNGVSQ